MEELTPEQKSQIRQQCIFCQICDGKVPAKKVYEDDKVLAILDINPANTGHILLLPKEHAAIMNQMDDELIGHMGVISKQLSQALLKALQVQGTNIFAANGPAAGQRAPHFMMHIIPRTEGDGIGLIPPNRKLNENEILQIHQALYEAVKKVLGDAVPPKKEGEKQTEPLEKQETKNEGTEKQEKQEEPKKEREKKEVEIESVTDPQLDSISDFLTKK